VVNDGLAFVTILSILAIVLETVPSLEMYNTLFRIIEWGSVIIFTCEYVARTMVHKPSWRYTLSFYGVIDLVSIAPTFLGLGNATFLKSARALRILRLLRVLRLVKLGRSVTQHREDVSEYVLTFHVLIYGVTLLCALLFTGVMMYILEPSFPAFSSIPVAMWWSFQVFLGSIPVATPETVLGNVGYAITRFTGLLLLGLLVGVVGNIFRTMMFPDTPQR
jgi:voltage-gated potassium channel